MKYFIKPFCISVVFLSGFFYWELNALPRPEPTQWELLFTILMIILLSTDIGLIRYRMHKGTCTIGAKRATHVAGVLGIVAMLCPACILLPITLFGLSVSLAFLTPFIPLLRGVVLFLLVVSTIMLLPRR